MKTRDNASGAKVFINIVSSPHIEAGSQHTRNSGSDITLRLNKLLCMKTTLHRICKGLEHSIKQLRVEAPHMKSYVELEGELGCRLPLSIGTPVEAGHFFRVAALCGARAVG